MKDLLKNIPYKDFFGQVPFNVCIINRDNDIVYANNEFKDYFGKWEGKKCYEVCKSKSMKCKQCQADFAFTSGNARIINESGIDANGRSCYYKSYHIPIKSDNGEYEHVIEMSFDITNSNNLQKEYNLLFDSVPSYITIIDKDYRIIRANDKFKQTFGDVRGKYCYQVYKKKNLPCERCPAFETFRNGMECASAQIGLTASGEKANYFVQTIPMAVDDSGPQLVIEIANDITEINSLQDQLSRIHEYYTKIINNTSEGIIALDKKGKTQILNDKAKELIEWSNNRKPGINKLRDILPENFFGDPDENGSLASAEGIEITGFDGKKSIIDFDSFEIIRKKDSLGKVAFLKDVSEFKELESKYLLAERAEAIQQIVKGLSHAIKNMLMSIDGGMYVLEKGLKSNQKDEILNGWDVLQRNYTKSGWLVKELMKFAIDNDPELTLVQPANIIKNVVDLYKLNAYDKGVMLITDIDEKTKPILFDTTAIETCLTNLLSNAIDASIRSDKASKNVIVKTVQKGDILAITVKDNGVGMSENQIKTIFTNLSSRKEGRGIGLGMIITQKLVKEHGGRFDIRSEPNKGTAVSMIFSKKKLELISNIINDKIDDFELDYI